MMEYWLPEVDGSTCIENKVIGFHRDKTGAKHIEHDLPLLTPVSSFRFHIKEYFETSVHACHMEFPCMDTLNYSYHMSHRLKYIIVAWIK